MTKNPWFNAVFAAVYIFAVAAVMYFGPRFAAGKDTFLAPVAMISLFTLSAAIMGYLFLSEPLQLYLGGEKKEAGQFFLKTLLLFALITLTLFVLLLTKPLS